MSKLTLFLWTGFLLRISNAFYNSFLGTSFGAGGGDAIFFHMWAIKYSKTLVFGDYVGGYIYPYILGVFYFLTTDSLFLGSVFSVFGWLASAFILIGIMRILSFDMSSQWKVIFLYSILPSALMYTSITMREPFQLLFVNLAIFGALKIYLHRSSAHWLTFIFALIGMGSLHSGLIVCGVFILSSTLILTLYRARKRISLVSSLLVTLFTVLSLYYGYQAIIYFTFNASSISLSAFIESINSYQNTTISYGARSTYATKIYIDSLSALSLKMPTFFFQYLFEPMPWRVSSIKDIIAFIENILRFWLIWNALKYFIFVSRKTPNFIDKKTFENKKVIVFIFLSYLLIEAIWAVGTTNWGTSIRHHLPSFGLLLIVGFAYQNVKNNNRLMFIRDSKTT